MYLNVIAFNTNINNYVYFNEQYSFVAWQKCLSFFFFFENTFVEKYISKCLKCIFNYKLKKKYLYVEESSLVLLQGNTCKTNYFSYFCHASINNLITAFLNHYKPFLTQTISFIYLC